MSSILTNLPQLTAATNSDWLYIVDVSDTTDNPAGSSKKILRGDLYAQITGFTYLNNTITLSLSDDSTYDVVINTMTGLTINGVLSATTYENLPLDVFTTGGTYSDGTLTFTNNSGGTFNVSGLITGDTYWISGSTGNFSIKAKNDSGLDATGDYAVAEGDMTIASGYASHAEGTNTIALSRSSHAEGMNNKVGLIGFNSTLNTGVITLDSSYGDVTSEFGTYAYIFYGGFTYKKIFHTITYSSGTNTEIFLYDTSLNLGTVFISGDYSFYSSNGDIAETDSGHVEGMGSQAIYHVSHAEGENTKSIGYASHSEGGGTTAFGIRSHAEGWLTKANGDASHAEGSYTLSNGFASHAEGTNTKSYGPYSHAEGTNTIAGYDGYKIDNVTNGVVQLKPYYGDVTSSFDSNGKVIIDTILYNFYSVTFSSGTNTEIFLNDTSVNSGMNISDINYLDKPLEDGNGQGGNAHAEGQSTIALNKASHAEGEETKALGLGSHAEGGFTITEGDYSHAGGYYSIASGNTSFIHSYESVVLGDRSVVLGGQGITGSTNDTVYVPYFNIQSAITDNLLTDILVLDVNGDVKTRDINTIGFTGGTVSGATIFTGGLSANTFSATTYYNLPLDVFTTGGTFNNSTGIATFTNNSGGTFDVSGFFKTSDDTYTTGFTFNVSNYDLTIKQNNGQTDLTVNLGILSSDITITGGTYNPTTGVATFTNNTGGTFSVSGFLTGMTDTYVSGFTYSNNNLTIKQTAGQPDLTVNISVLTGLTVNGNVNITGQTTTGSISATTYYNLPQDIFTTGGTYNNSTGIATFTNNSGGTFNVSGFFTGSTDNYTTGYTYNNNTFTIKRNNGLSDLTATINTMTGLTINGNLTVTGQTTTNSLSASTLTATTITATDYQNLPFTDNQTIEGFVSGSSTYVRIKEVVAAPSGGTRTFQGNVVISSGFTANTISATTYYNLPLDVFTTGGTYNNTTGVATFTNNSGGTFNVSGFFTGSTDNYTTGYTYSNNTFTIKRNNGLPDLSATINTMTGLTINGNVNITGQTTSGSVSATTITADTITANNYQNLPFTDNQTLEIFLSGGSEYVRVKDTVSAPSGGTRVFQGNVVVNSGFTATTISATTYYNLPVTADTFTTGFTFNVSNYDLTIKQNNSKPDLTVNLGILASDITITGGTYNPTTGIATFTNNTGGTFSVSGFLTGMTDTYVSGFTYNNNNLTIKQTAGQPDLTINISTLTGLTINGNINITGQTTSGSISATTYYNLPLDVFTTGGTYSNGTLTFTNNSGGTFNVSGLITGDTYWTSGSTGNYSIKANNNSGLDATGDYAVAEGYGTIASGPGSHAQGANTIASGLTSHSEGSNTISGGYASHAEGESSVATGDHSHAEGSTTTASGDGSHSEGADTTASGEASHAEGSNTIASGTFSHAEGSYTTASAGSSHAEGSNTTASGDYSHAEGLYSVASGESSHAEGIYTQAIGNGSHSEGGYYDGVDYVSGGTAIGHGSHAEGRRTISGWKSFTVESVINGLIRINASYGDITAEFVGYKVILDTKIYTYNTVTFSSTTNTEILLNDLSVNSGSYVADINNLNSPYGDIGDNGVNSHAEGSQTKSLGYYSHAEGSLTTASGNYGSHAEGSGTLASGNYGSHAEGDTTTASGDYSHAEGQFSVASGESSHAEGGGTTASGRWSHAEGNSTIASGEISHAEGNSTTASGIQSHAEGAFTTASGDYSHSQGYSTNAINYGSHAGGLNSNAEGSVSFIHSTDSKVLGDRSVVLGGQGITGSTNDTVYVPYFNIQSATTDNTLTEVLVKDTNGDVKTRDLSTIVVSGTPFYLSDSPSVDAGSDKTSTIQRNGGVIIGDYVSSAATGYFASIFNDSISVVNSGFTYVSLNSYTDNNAFVPSMRMYRQRGTQTSPLNLLNNDKIGDLSFTSNAYGTSAETTSILGSVEVYANENFSGGTFVATNMGSRMEFYLVPNGSISKTKALSIVGSGDTRVYGNLTASTVSATTYYNLPLDVFTTGGTYNNSTGIATFTNNSGGTFNVSGFTTTTPTLSQVLSSGNTTSGYDIIISSGDTISNTGGTSSIYFGYGIEPNGVNLQSGISTYKSIITAQELNGVSFYHVHTGTTSVSSVTVHETNGISLQAYDNTFTDQYTTIYQTGDAIIVEGDSTIGSGSTFSGIEYFVDYSNNYTNRSLVDKEYVDNLVSVSGAYLPLSGGTVSGATNFTAGLTANTFYTQYIDFNTTATTTHQEGRIHWNDTIKTLEIDTENSGVQIKVGHDLVMRVNNQTAATLLKGRVVYINGQQGQRPTVTLASYTADTTSASVIGLVMADINVSSNGYIITNGILEGVDTSAYSAGTPLYLYTGGTLTSTKPQAPNHDVRIGKVIVSNATTGSIAVTIQNGYELDELHDVRITSATTGDLLVRSTYSGSDVWVNTKTLTGNYNVNGTLSATTLSATTLTATTITATDYQNLPFTDNQTIEGFVSGSSTYVRIKDVVAAPSGGTRTFQGNVVISSGFTANTISATTYQNLPLDVFTTGGTYNSGTGVATFTNNSGGTFSVSGFTTGGGGSFTGGTVPGATNFTGGLSATTISATTYQNLPLDIYPTGNETFRGFTVRNNSTTIDTFGGITTSASASQSAISVSTTDFISKQVRTRYFASIVQTGRYTGIRGTSLLWYVGGGFRYVCDFGISDTAYGAGCQNFYGLGGYTTDLAYGGNPIVNLSTLTNIIGVGNDPSDTNLQIVYNDSTGTASKIDLGSGFPSNRTSGATLTTMYSITLYNAPTSTSVKYRVVNNESGAIAEGTISTDLPATTQGLNFFASRTMNVPITNTGQFDISKLGVYSII